ncbi:tRNA uridine-5-carboxymethylaminomethyl(34) synthesis GTPase MnmE [Bombilactobacillus thymidiniphilus]|uniref:tRNA modification GTPase MnmE n=1 Tax=Bombilactobacillus thymidiniphilus TaxID=2923363 RepID=A0ABY4PBA9_9LACO|nr:tRNA uridine-5-carboxymethylaminomethyl(34) synthesis GTPase MnmE [Bombilactobacillus thymidiniphilus]UQS82967.1 tRNA uridine-5-carboxymethylaminomethyl(34) synthesis GTPase MnmE [Bombilactobacillus thymidiniphilus]
MTEITEFDTIAAISTPSGEGAIAIVRLSGEQAVAVANKVTRGCNLTKVASHTINYSHVIDPQTQEVIDEVMVSVMRAPKTFTREDVVEINTHGGLMATNRVLQILLSNGARLAEPGEFTKRAFLNGRIDLTQAESVMDLIRSKTDRAMQQALNQLDGSLAHLIKNLRQEILEVLAQVEVNIDYPEYDNDELTLQMLLEKAQQVQSQIQQLLKTASEGQIINEGLKTAIVGKPNVGKSSLLNVLAHQDRAIVTDVAGTTRDVIEQLANVNGIPLQLVDTAGIHETADKVEKIGVDRSMQAIDTADLILLVLDGSRFLSAEDQQLLQLTKNKKRIIVVNKADLPQILDLKTIDCDPQEIVQISAVAQQGIDQIEQNIQRLFFTGITTQQNTAVVTNARQVGLLKQAQQALSDVVAGIKQQMPIDLVQIDMTNCWDKLGEITGESAPDELITQLFSQFCVGK